MNEQTETKPTMRIRIQHSHTLKDGWRCAETTVEWSGPADSPYPRSDVMAREMESAHTQGLTEAMRRNAVEAAL